MPELGVDEVLTTTRAVRRRLDLTRPIEPALVRECLAIALQAPTGGNNQDWHFVVVTDAAKRAAVAEEFKAGALEYAQMEKPAKPRREFTDDEKAARKRVMASSGYLFEHLAEVPCLVIACVEGRFDGAPLVVQATAFARSSPPYGASCSRRVPAARPSGSSDRPAHGHPLQTVPTEMLGRPAFNAGDAAGSGCGPISDAGVAACASHVMRSDPET
ncbi:MAG: nitroreductase [Acidimicrobiia bacterium]|nr:nitroreductase [Acidimicrobiia bacterium]